MQGKDPYEGAETQQRLLAELRKFEALVDKFASDRTALDALWKEMNSKAEEKDPRFKTAISVARDGHAIHWCFLVPNLCQTSFNIATNILEGGLNFDSLIRVIEE